jgi:hypothetical protein
MTETTVAGRPGNRVVLTIYGSIVAIAGVMGFVIGSIRPRDLDPELFGFVQLPPTPVGVAVYGMVTVAVGLGVLLGLVVYVSDLYDTEST